MKRRREAKHRRSTIGEVLHVTPYKGGGNLSEVSAEQLALKAAKRQDLISNKKINKGKGRSAKGNKGSSTNPKPNRKEGEPGNSGNLGRGGALDALIGVEPRQTL